MVCEPNESSMPTLMSIVADLGSDILRGRSRFGTRPGFAVRQRLG